MYINSFCAMPVQTHKHTHTHMHVCAHVHTHTQHTHPCPVWLWGQQTDRAKSRYCQFTILLLWQLWPYIYMYQQIKQASLLLWQKWYPLNNDYQINVGCTTCRFGFGVPVPNCRSLKHWVHTMAELCNWSHIFATWCDVMQPNDKSVNLL